MLEFSKKILENIVYRKYFNENSFLHGKLFGEYYLEKISNFDDVYNLAVPKCLEYIQMSADDAVAVLVDKGIYDYDRNSFIDRFGIVETFMADVETLISKYNEIEEFGKNLREVRDIQKNSRSHWVGGGFGIRGAIKGAVKAGILNAGTGIIRGIGDSFADAIGSRKINSMKREAFESGNFGEILRDSVYNLDVKIGYYLCVVLSEHGIISNVIELIDENILQRKINNIRLQAANNKISIDKSVDEITKWILQNPFSFKYYACLYFLLGRKGDFVKELCEILGYIQEFESYKGIFADSVISGIEASNEETNEKLKTLRHVKNTYEFPAVQLQKLTAIENALITQQNSEREITAQIENDFLEESKADALLQEGRVEEVWEMLDGKNALIEYKLTKYYENLVKPFIDRRDFANIERKMNYVYEQSDDGNSFAIYLVSYIRRLVYMRTGDKDRVIKMDEKILKLADNGVVSACASVGFFCYEGQGYFKRDYKEAFKYLSFASAKNHPTAMAWLGEMYLKGDGVEKDFQTAQKWLTLAAHYGHPYAIKELEKLNGRN